jgi:hypothetical protein
MLAYPPATARGTSVGVTSGVPCPGHVPRARLPAGGRRSAAWLGPQVSPALAPVIGRATGLSLGQVKIRWVGRLQGGRLQRGGMAQSKGRLKTLKIKGQTKNPGKGKKRPTDFFFLSGLCASVVGIAPHLSTLATGTGCGTFLCELVPSKKTLYGVALRSIFFVRC